MKIAIFIDNYGGNFIGGGQIHVKNLINNLQKKGIKVKLFSQPNPNIVARFLWSILVIPKFIIRNKSQKFDLIHSHGYIPGLSAYLCAKLTHLPIVHTVHGSNLLDQNEISFKAKLEKFLLTQIPYDAQITVNPKFLSYPNKSKRKIYIPNGINLSQIKPHPWENSFLFVGRLEKIKGINYLLNALNKLSNHNWTLTVVGNGSQKPNLEKLVEKYNLINKIKFTGLVKPEKLSQFYQASDVFILPSLSEGLPITILEALSHKLTVIATKVGGVPDLINENTGILINPKSTSDLIKSLSWVINHPEKAKQLGINGYKKIQTTYSWSNITSQIIKVYQSLN
jgi:glycosyltransferase involved in cell wall biosynthesis